MIVSNSVHLLRQQCLANSTRPFLARGKSVRRCAVCLLAEPVCICTWAVTRDSEVDFVLLLHHDEVFKPTNTGRLIADIFPANVSAFEWSRTEPAADLLALLADPARYPVIVFPADETSGRTIHTSAPPLQGKRLTLLLLDGTWRQASRMFRSSAWLADLPVLTFASAQEGRYAVRQKIRDGQLATAEAAAELLRLCGEEANGEVLEDYFLVFNEHYLATRSGRPVEQLPAHQRLAALRVGG
ncbi:MAG: DTW domain-containing protein [Cellvibrionaceae bacterium]|nr:DTW domain-containing protein [Cellvibrionaceae bacterium]